MKIKISEVWNDVGQSKELTILDTDENPYMAVQDWIDKNRPDLRLARGLFAHGYHAVGVTK